MLLKVNNNEIKVIFLLIVNIWVLKNFTLKGFLFIFALNNNEEFVVKKILFCTIALFRLLKMSYSGA